MALPQTDALAKQALKILAQEGWDSPKLDTLVDQANKTALIPLIVTFIDQQAEQALDLAPDDTPYDRVFEALMTRFEIMTPYRQGLQVLAEQCRHKPPLALCLYRAKDQSIRRLLLFLNLPEKHAYKYFGTPALLAVYHLVFHRWLDDESASLQCTMAMLNATLQACKIGILLA